MRSQYELTPFGSKVKVRLAQEDKTVKWLGDQIRAMNIPCYDEQISKCLRGRLKNEKILSAIETVVNFKRDNAELPTNT